MITENEKILLIILFGLFFHPYFTFCELFVYIQHVSLLRKHFLAWLKVQFCSEKWDAQAYF